MSAGLRGSSPGKKPKKPLFLYCRVFACESVQIALFSFPKKLLRAVLYSNKETGEGGTKNHQQNTRFCLETFV